MIIRQDLEDVLQRTQRFNRSNKKGIALIQVREIQSLQRPRCKPLNHWNFPTEMEAYLDAEAERALGYWEKRKDLKDDLFPSLAPWFGIAEHSAFVGGNVDFSEDTSWHHPIIKDWSDLDKLELREDNTWLNMVTGGLRYLREKWGDRFMIKLRGADGPMDIANAIRGNDLFTDFFEYPDEVHQLMDFCTEAVKWTLDRQKEAAGTVGDGVISGFDVWLPGNSAGHLSEDASALCSPAIYQEFGKPYTTKLCANFDHTFVHTHALGKHSIEAIASIPHMDYIEISSDPNCLRAVEIYAGLKDKLEGKTIILDLTREEMKNNLALLKESKTIIWYKAENLQDAEETVAWVRKELGSE